MMFSTSVLTSNVPNSSSIRADTLPGQHEYEVSDLSRVMTPALAIYPDIVRQNISATLGLMGGNPNRWRPHVKTAKIGAVMQMLTECGVTKFKCATTLELTTAILAGAKDVLIAYPLTGANALRVREIAEVEPDVRISALVESSDQIAIWQGTRVSLFVDINPGMNRTGIEQQDLPRILALVKAIQNSGVEFRGLHYYDGHLHNLDLGVLTTEAHSGYRRLLEIISSLQAKGVDVQEVITSGTPTLYPALNFAGFQNAKFLHQVSAGTVVYCDARSLQQLPTGYAPAALVISRVISNPCKGIITCDAGHKTMAVDVGVPHCSVMGRPGLVPKAPSEEHLPLALEPDGIPPQLGSFVYLVPYHVCPTVNNFDDALFIRNYKIDSIETVSARGREMPLLG